MGAGEGTDTAAPKQGSFVQRCIALPGAAYARLRRLLVKRTPTTGVSFEVVREAERQQIGVPADADLAGLALSGGGIRSATFNLGVLQALAHHGLLSRVHYLSTVSGGGYIGSWLSAWLVESRSTIEQVEDELAGYKEPKPVSYLREYSNYLTPRVGWLSPDTLTMAATYFRNFLLNLTIIVSWFALFMLVPWGVGKLGRHSAEWLLGPAVVLLLLAVLAIVANVVWQELDENRPDDDTPGRDRAPRFTGTLWVNLLIVLPLVLWACAFSLVLRQKPELLNLAEWSFAGIGLCAGFVMVRHLLLQWFRTHRKLKGRFSVWRRGFAFMAGTLAGVALLHVVTQAFSKMSPWHVLVWGLPAMLGVFLLGATIVLGVSGRTESEYAREWWSRLGGLLFRVMLAWVVLSGAAVYGPLIVAQLGVLAAAHLSVAWLVTTIASVVVGKSPATGADGSRRWLELIPKVGPYVFIIGLLVAISSALYTALVDGAWTFAWPEGYFWQLDAIEPLRAAKLALGLLALALLLSAAVDVNLFSFHMFYRNRLVRCYLGASRPGQRRSLPFIGFDPKDNPALTALQTRPYHIVNTALNLTSSEQLGWQERKAASFVMTRDYCGYEYPNVGPSGALIKDCFQRTERYAFNSSGSLNLGTAMAISGAAANPNMGYHSSPSVAFLLTVFNVRLGWWMQNTSNLERWCAGGPHFGLWYLLRELFGISNDRSKFVQLSDGGHFDNLGIYELVRRRCRFIIVTDVSEDRAFEFEDLGNAIRKASIDQLADIEIETRAIVPESGKRHSLHHCAVGTIRYKDGTAPGYLLYIKPSLTGNEPADVAQYAVANPTFPHESTGDQFFSESQFESYRKLGYHICKAVFDEAAKKARWEPKPKVSNPSVPDVTGTGDERVLDLEALFVALKERWSAPASRGSATFARHGDQFSKLQDTLRTDSRLAFLNIQVYPEWDAVLAALPAAQIDAARDKAAQTVKEWLPASAEERRAGFHFCNGMLQLMENVYADLNLQQDHNHPDNRGWMNLFRQWSWSGMFQVTYAVCCSMYGARFQTFCECVLDLAPGRVRVDRAGWGDMDKLNAVERDIARRLQKAGVAGEGDELYLLQTVVEAPPDGDGAKSSFTYTFGYAIARGDEMRYFRIQDHVRQMGNARRALNALLDCNDALRPYTSPAHERTVSRVLDEPQDFAGFVRLFRSVEQQRRAAKIPA